MVCRSWLIPSIVPPRSLKWPRSCPGPVLATRGFADRAPEDVLSVVNVGFPHIAVLVPCYNEEVAIPIVVRDFRKALPEATIYVYDNNSQDRTIKAARAAGAVIGAETLQGKGNVVRRMFADIEADVYVLVDGDGTYDAAAAPRLISILLAHQLDMVNARRVTEAIEAYRAGHRFGNMLLSEHGQHDLRQPMPRRTIGISRIVAPLREELSRALRGVRDRDRAHHSRA